MLKSDVTIYKLLWENTLLEDREKWFVDRHEAFSYKSKFEGEEACEEVYHLTNAPEDLLEDYQKEIIKDFKGSPLSVGDVVRVETLVKGLKTADYYLCKSFGWEKFDGDVIQLLKHFSW